VRYIAIDDTDNLQSVPANIDALISQYQATVFEYQAPDEWRLDQQLYQHGRRANIPGSWLIANISIQTATKCPTSLPDANNG
jgi:deoxyribodipyrimidine photolyase-related protein